MYKLKSKNYPLPYPLRLQRHPFSAPDVSKCVFDTSGDYQKHERRFPMEKELIYRGDKSIQTFNVPDIIQLRRKEN